MVGASLLAAALSASAADVFLVIGQSSGRWRADEALTVSIPSQTQSAALSSTSIPDDVRMLELPISLNCDADCQSNRQLGSLQYGPLPAFARSWARLSQQPAYFLVRSKSDARLTKPDGAQPKDYWTSFNDPQAQPGIYKIAVADFKAVQRQVNASADGLDKSYVIWIPSDQDAKAGVGTELYRAKLKELFNRLNADMGQAEGNKPFDAMLVVSPGYFPGYYASSTDAIKANRDKVNAIVSAQDLAAASDEVVQISRARRLQSIPCEGGTPECPSTNAETSADEALGAEMARNAFVYRSKGIKPLQASSCAADPESCGATVDIYRWVAGDDDNAKTVYGAAPKEFDATPYQFAGASFQLFQDPAIGRMPLYRSPATTDSAGTLSTTSEPTEGARMLGYCYAAISPNAAKPLLGVNKGARQVVTRDPQEAAALTAAGFSEPTTLCFVN